MVIQFSKESGMNLEWSQKSVQMACFKASDDLCVICRCLAQNNWVYLQSAQAFTVLQVDRTGHLVLTCLTFLSTLQSNSSIPPEAFIKH